MDNHNTNSGIRDVARNFNESLFRGRRWDNERAKQADAMGGLAKDKHSGDVWNPVPGEKDLSEFAPDWDLQQIPNARPLWWGDPYLENTWPLDKSLPNHPIQPENPGQIPYEKPPYKPDYWFYPGYDPEEMWQLLLDEHQYGQEYSMDPELLRKLFPDKWQYGWGVDLPGIIV